jgi:hypothetical protein
LKLIIQKGLLGLAPGFHLGQTWGVTHFIREHTMQTSIKLFVTAAAMTLAHGVFANPTELNCAERVKDCNANVHVVKAAAGAACQANVGNGQIKVKRGIGPVRHVWKIVAAPKDKGQYEWDIPNGIEITKDADHQVQNYGVNKNGHFWILNANTVPGSEIEYIAHVHQVVNHATNEKCESVDPRIINIR